MGSAKQTGLTIVGAGIGFFAGGGPMGAMYGAQIGYSLGMSSLSTTLPTQTGPRLDDLQAQTAEYGSPIGKSWGTVRRAGVVIWSSEIIETKHEETVSQGGKGVPKQSQTYETFTYDTNFAVAFNDGEIKAIRRIWLNEHIVYDRGKVDDYGTLSDEETTAWIATKAYALEGGGELTVYTGTETQEPDPTIESFEGVGEVPGFRGVAYLVFSNLELARFGNRRPNVLVEFIAVNDDPSAGYELIKTIDVEGITWGTYPHQVGCFEDDGTAHFFTGNWTYSHFSSGLVRYYKVFPSGATSFIRQVGSSTRLGLFGHQGRIPAWGDGYGGRSIIEPEGALHDPDLSFVTGLNDTGLSSAGAAGLKTCQIGNKVNGTIAYCADQAGTTSTNKFRLYKYNKFVEVALVFPDTDVEYDILDISHPAGATYAWTLSENYLYMLITGVNHGIYQYDHDGNLVDSWPGQGSYHNSASTTVMTTDRDDETKIVWGAGNHYYQFDTLTGTETQYANACSESSRSDTNNIMFKGGLVFEHYVGGDAILVKSLGTVSKTGERLDRIVSDLCTTHASLTSSQIDVTALAGITVDGFTHSNGPPSKAIEALMTAYQFSAYEDENKIIFKLRDGSSDKTIDPDDLGCGVDNPTLETLPYKRLDDQSMPRAVNVHFSDYANEYARGAQQAKRLRALVNSEQVLDVELPLVLTTDDARQIAQRVLNTVYASRVEYAKFTLPLTYLDIVPTDILSIPLNGTAHEIRATAVTISDVVEIIGVSNDQASYSSDITGFGVSQPYRGSAYTGPTEIYLLNLPPLRNQDSDTGFYVAAHGYHPDWRGCALYTESSTGGFVKNVDIVGAITAAVATSALPDSVSTTIDYTSTLDITMRNGTPTSSTKAAVLANETVNAIAVGVDGRWEIMQFITATDNGDGDYTLSGFIRGKQGTEFAMDQHAVNDYVIFLDVNKMARANSDDTSQGYDYRAVSFGQDFRYGTRKVFTNTARTAKPVSPVHVKTEDVGGGDFDISWVRRARVHSNWRDLADVPLGETSEEYTVRVVDTDQTTEVSSATVTTNTATVAASAGQYVQVAQNSDYYGPGEYTELVEL